jgi:hypothetical protein
MPKIVSRGSHAPAVGGGGVCSHLAQPVVRAVRHYRAPHKAVLGRLRPGAILLDSVGMFL